MSKAQIRLAIAGAGGRMGRQLIIAIAQTPGVVLGGAFTHTDSSLVGQDAGELVGVGSLGVLMTADLEQQAQAFDILIDFTRPENTLRNLAFCVAHHKKMVIGTTGFDEPGKAAIFDAGRSIGIIFAANFSVGVNVMLKLLEKTAQVMGEQSDIEIIEAHHRHKVDAPSGTALAMGERIASVLGRDLKHCAVYARKGHTGERDPKSIGFATVRAGDIVGEHKALFADIGECVEISHKASSRAIFAKGAIRAADWVNDKKLGVFDMCDVLFLNNL